MPDLVDCSRECQKSAIEVFKLLDADADGELSPSDATLLTQDTFMSLSHQLDDLVDELNDLAREQWEEAMEVGIVVGNNGGKSALRVFDVQE